jgi:hypothetical protein
VLLVALAALGAGCAGGSDRGRETIYRHEPLAVAALIAAGAVLPALCWKAYRRSPDGGLMVRCLLAGMILPPVCALGLTPAWIRDRIRVDDDGFAAVGRALLERRFQAVRFDQLAGIRLQTETVEERRRRGGKRTVQKQDLIFPMKDGTSEMF